MVVLPDQGSRPCDLINLLTPSTLVDLTDPFRLHRKRARPKVVGIQQLFTACNPPDPLDGGRCIPYLPRVLQFLLYDRPPRPAGRATRPQAGSGSQPYGFRDRVTRRVDQTPPSTPRSRSRGRDHGLGQAKDSRRSLDTPLFTGASEPAAKR